MVHGRGGRILGRVHYLLDMCVMKNVLKLNKRDWIGLSCWLLVSILIGLLALPVMIGREVYQYKHYHLAKFEWEDIIRYSFVVIVGSVIHILLWQQ